MSDFPRGKTLGELVGGYNASLKVMQKNVFDLGITFDNFKKKTEKVTKAVKEQAKAENELDIRFERRTRALSDATAALNKQGKAFEIFSKSSRVAFKEAGGNIFEFFDVALSSASEQVKIFGLEAANARKIMYGFLPPGMFRMVNKLSTGFRTLGSVTRNLKMGEAEEGEANNIFTTIGKAAKKISPSKIFGSGSKVAKTKVRAAKTRISELESRKRTEGVLTDAEDKELAGKKSFVARKTTAFEKTKDAVAAIPARIEKARAFLELAFLKSKLKARRLEDRFLRAGNKFLSMSNKERGKTLLDQFLKLVKTPIMQFLLTGLLYLTGIAIVVVLIRKTIWPALQEAFKVFKNNLGILLAGLANIWTGVKDVFMGLINGDLMQMLDGIFTIAWGLVQVALGILWATASGLFTLAWKTIENLFNGAIQFISDTFTSVKGFKENFGKLAIVIVAAIAFFFGLPAALVALGVFVIMAGVKWIWKKIKGFGLFASGGMVNDGMAIVGEKGPELVSLPRGSRVHSNSNSKRMGGGGVVNNINITVNAKDTSKAEMKRIADELGKTITKQITRTVSKGIFR